jgi:hypothetical protein
MRELITTKGTQRACLYGLGVLGLLGPSPPAKSKSKSTVTFPNDGYTSKAQRCRALLSLTEEFAVELARCLWLGKPTLSCFLPVTNVFQLTIQCTYVQSCFVRAR